MSRENIFLQFPCSLLVMVGYMVVQGNKAKVGRNCFVDRHVKNAAVAR